MTQSINPDDEQILIEFREYLNLKVNTSELLNKKDLCLICRRYGINPKKVKNNLAFLTGEVISSQELENEFYNPDKFKNSLEYVKNKVRKEKFYFASGLEKVIADKNKQNQLHCDLVIGSIPQILKEEYSKQTFNTDLNDNKY